MNRKNLLILFILLSTGALTQCGPAQLEKQLEDASVIDNSTAAYAQLLIGGLNGVSEISVTAVNERSNIVSSKASVDGVTDTVYVKYAFEKGTPGGSFGDSANAITLLKVRTPEGIKYITEVDYTVNDDPPATCKEINKYVYEQTRLLLTEQQRLKYDSEGKQLSFIDDTVFEQGGDWYPTDQDTLITDNDTHLRISSVSLVSDFDAAIYDDDNNTDNLKNQYGVQYCKVISSQNMLIWMLENAFDSSAGLMEPDEDTLLSCEDLETSRGSCYFRFFIPGFADSYFCEDYIGSDYTGGAGGTAETKCLDTREGDYLDGVPCADRTEITDINTTVGICAVSETDEGAYTWTLYEPDDADDCPRRFFTCDE